MPSKNVKGKKGIIFWLGIFLGALLVAVSIWYVIASYVATHDAAFSGLVIIPTILFLAGLIVALFSKKAGAIAYGVLFALVLATSIVQGTYWVLYIIPAWLFLAGTCITISIWEK
ncbi:MAG: hypothetical protein WC080_01140 [Patescibacteria group bacterium]